MQLIAPHLRRSLLAGKAVRQRSIQAARLTDMLDGIDAAVFFMDGEGRILHENANGAAMLADGVSSGAAIEGQPASENVTGEALPAAFTSVLCLHVISRVCAHGRGRHGSCLRRAQL